MWSNSNPLIRWLALNNLWFSNPHSFLYIHGNLTFYESTIMTALDFISLGRNDSRSSFLAFCGVYLTPWRLDFAFCNYLQTTQTPRVMRHGLCVSVRMKYLHPSEQIKRDSFTWPHLFASVWELVFLTADISGEKLRLRKRGGMTG